MPVSRKRKKKPGKSGKARRSSVRGLAAGVATELVADLVKVAPDVILEDVLCERLGELLHASRREMPDNRVGPLQLAEALVPAAEVVAREWRVFAALAGVLPYPLGEAAAEAAIRLRPERPGPAVTGPVLWTRDRYGSRFGVAAPITTGDQPERWYLWDIDACGHDTFTVHSGYYSTPDEALAAWQDGVGQLASAGTVLEPVDDPWLLRSLLPAEMGAMRPGGESVEQFAEYHRSKRLAEMVSNFLPRPEIRDRGLTADIAAAEFAAWVRAGRQGVPEELDELATELAGSWNISEIDAVYATCSPHRVALFVSHVRDYYEGDFAERLVALLPSWVRWLARDATPAELADRCLPYAQGQPHPQLDGEVNYLARVTE